MTRLFILRLNLCLIVYTLIIFPTNVQAQEPLIIQGRVVNMTRDGVVPKNLTVTLHIIDTNGGIDIITTDANDGFFNIQISELNQQSLYVLSTLHQNVHYSEEIINLSPEMADSRVIDLIIYEATDSPEFISSIDTVFLVTRADPISNEVQIFERVTLMNAGDRSYVPDLEHPEKMNFLRFSLPSRSTNLDVRSTLMGGSILTVDKGFAITSAVPPGESELRYSYQSPYSGNEIKFDKSFHWDTKIFRVMIPKTIGLLNANDDPLVESANIGNVPYYILEKHGIPKESQVLVHFSDLPQLSVWNRSWHEITKKENAPIMVASGMGATLILILIFSIRKNRSNSSIKSRSPDKQNTINTVDETIIHSIAQLDNMFDAGLIERTKYVNKRNTLKTTLLETHSKLYESSVKLHPNNTPTKSENK